MRAGRSSIEGRIVRLLWSARTLAFVLGIVIFGCAMLFILQP
jgi:hypothetical protein